MPRITTHARSSRRRAWRTAVPGAPPLTTAGKQDVRLGHRSRASRPGDLHGHVLLNAHVWPDGSAVGNRMLAKLHEGDRIVVSARPRSSATG